MWVILLQPPSTAGEVDADKYGEGGQSVIAALATAVPYHDGLYVCNLCVLPDLRRLGLGLDVLELCALLAIEGGRDTLIGNADLEGGEAGIVDYYRRLGATAVTTGGIGSSGGGGGGRIVFAGTTVRLRRMVGGTRGEVTELFALLREGRRRWGARRRLYVMAAMAAAVAAVASFLLHSLTAS